LTNRVARRAAVGRIPECDKLTSLRECRLVESFSEKPTHPADMDLVGSLLPATLGAVVEHRQRTARVITSLNLKGGVGKTHLCWLIAGVCQERGKRCLVVDLDKQGNISTTLLGENIAGPGAEAFFNPAVDPQVHSLVRRSHLNFIDAIPGNFALEQFNITDPTKWEASGLVSSLVDPLREVSPLYDYILIDCPADISLITYAALCASDFLLIPLEAAQWGALGTNHVVKTLEHVQQRHNATLKLLGYVVSRYKMVRKYQSTYTDRLREKFGDDAFATAIPDLSLFEQAVTDRIPIVLHSPTSHAAGIARSFFDELESRAERLAGVGDAGSGRGVRKPVVALA
jgi:chromosome partitioning protein